MIKSYTRKKLKSLFKIGYPVVAKIKIPYASKSVLIVRLDAIGDYVLFRNSIHYIKNSPKYKHCDFYLLGNKRFEGLASYLDGKEFKECIWIDPEILRNTNNKERFLLLLKLKFRAFDFIINPVHSRLYFIDKFISELGGKIKIGSRGDVVNWQMPNFTELSKKYYNQLIEVPGTDCFEFYRNKKFVENLLGENFASFDLHIPPPATVIKDDSGISKIKIVVVPGASDPRRCWSIYNFIEVVKILSEFLRNNVTFVITGSTSEKHLGTLIKNNISADVSIENRAGETELVDLVRLINNADLLISNETSTVHIAAACNTPAICISKPNLYGRFHPYPTEMGKVVKTIYPSEFQHDSNIAENNAAFFNLQSEVDINSVSVDVVVNYAKLFLSNSKKSSQMAD